MPDRPRDVALNQVKLKFIDRERFAVVEAMFLQAVLRIPSKKIDVILNSLYIFHLSKFYIQNLS